MKKILGLALVAITLASCATTSGVSKVDKEKANYVASLIDQIYVQKRTDLTDEQCKIAKQEWDNLSELQKSLVSGTNADPDYFGLDTGDASLDNPLNQDNIGKDEILVVSFGTSFNKSRAEDIGGIEKAIQASYPTWSVRRAFTAQIIINHIQSRDNEYIDNMDQALNRAVKNNVKRLVVQPTHLMHGAEYDELCEAIKKYEDKFEKVIVAEPLLGSVGKDGSSFNEDKESVTKAITKQAFISAGYDSLENAAFNKTAFVFLGHGTSHRAKVSYTQMAGQAKALGYENVFIGTVEGEPEETECSNVINNVKEAGFTTVVLRPLMVVAGDHANNDMAGDDEQSWKSMFEASKAFKSINCQISGLGSIPEIQKLYIEHTAKAISAISK